jgi:hypothetical protein
LIDPSAISKFDFRPRAITAKIIGGRQCKIVPNALTFEALSGTDDVEFCPQQ